MMNFSWKYTAALLPIPFFIILIVGLSFLNLQAVFEPPYLLLLTSTIFLGLIPAYISVVALRSFLAGGSTSTGLLGAGMLAIAIGALASGLARVHPDGANMSVTIFNTLILAGALLIFAAGVVSFSGREPGPGRNARDTIAAMVYGGTVIFCLLLIGGTISGLTPVFFIQGSGPTLIRDFVLSGAIWIFAITSVLFYRAGSRDSNAFFIWYSVGLGLLAVGLLGVFPQQSVGSLSGWMGRLAQYAGASYLLVAMIAARRAAGLQGIPIEGAIARFFSEAGYQHLIERNGEKAFSMFDATPVAHSLASFPEGRLRDVNEAWLALTGFTRKEEVLGKTFVEIGLVHDDRAYQGLIEELRRKGSVRNAPLTFTSGDGEELSMLLDMQRIEIGGNRFIFSTTFDITNLRLAEENVERLLTLMNHNPSLIFLKDESGRYVYLNEEYERLFVRSKDWHGKTDFDFWPNESAELFCSNDSAVLASGQAKQFLEDSRGPDGRRYCWLCYKFPFIDSNGRKYLGGIGINVTERILAEEALREREELFQSIFEESPIGIELYNAEGKLLGINREAKRIFGVKDADVLKVFDLFADTTMTDEVKHKIRQGMKIHYTTLFDFEKFRNLKLYPTEKTGTIDFDVTIVPLHGTSGGADYRLSRAATGYN